MSGLHSHPQGLLPLAPQPPVVRAQNRYFWKMWEWGLFQLAPDDLKSLSEPELAGWVLSVAPSEWIQEVEQEQLDAEAELRQMVESIYRFDREGLDFVAFFRPDQIKLLLKTQDVIIPRTDQYEDGPVLPGESCSICLHEAHVKMNDLMYICRGCIRNMVRLSCTSEANFPLQLEGTHLPDELIKEARRPELTHLYFQRKMEWHVGKDPTMRVYCADTRCGAFIGHADSMKECLDSFVLDEGYVCPICYQPTCPNCKTNAHFGECQYDVTDEDVWKAMDEAELVNCPRCAAIISLKDGCNHMTCLCGHEFCYLCGRDSCREYPGCENHCELYNSRESRLPIAERAGKKPERFLKRPVAPPKRPHLEQRWFRLPPLPTEPRHYGAERRLLAAMDPRRLGADDAVVRVDDAAVIETLSQSPTTVKEALRVMNELSAELKLGARTAEAQLELEAIEWGVMCMALGPFTEGQDPLCPVDLAAFLDMLKRGGNWEYYRSMLGSQYKYGQERLIQRLRLLYLGCGFEESYNDLGRPAPFMAVKRPPTMEMQHLILQLESMVRYIRVQPRLLPVVGRSGELLPFEAATAEKLEENAAVIDSAVRGIKAFLGAPARRPHRALRRANVIREAERADRRRTVPGKPGRTSAQRRARKKVSRARARGGGRPLTYTLA